MKALRATVRLFYGRGHVATSGGRAAVPLQHDYRFGFGFRVSGLGLGFNDLGVRVWGFEYRRSEFGEI